MKHNPLIKYYKSCINPLMPSMCKHTPSCSAYMSQAIKIHGFAKGVAMGTARLVRCNPFSQGGFDPPKDNLKGNAKWLL